MDYEFGDVVHTDYGRHLVLGVATKPFTVTDFLVTAEDSDDTMRAAPGRIVVFCIDALSEIPFGFIDAVAEEKLTKED